MAPPAAVVSRQLGLLLVSALCAAGAILVAAVGHPPAPTLLTSLTLAGQALIALALGLSVGTPNAPRRIALIALCAGTAVSASFFGVHSSFAGVVSVVLVLAGLITSGNDAPWVGWAAYGTIAAGELAVFALVSAGVLPDHALARVNLEGHPAWHYWAAHLVLQGIYAAAFVTGRVAARRYLRLLAEIRELQRQTSTREALVAEARADYQRALEIARRGLVAPPGLAYRPPSAGADEPTSSITIEQSSLMLPTADAQPPPLPPSTTEEQPSPFAETRPLPIAWLDAYRAKLRGQDGGALALCGAGAVLLGLITREDIARHVAWATIAAIALAILVRNALERRDPDDPVYWPYAVVGVLSVGPAYALGLHSGFAAVIATMLFAGGLFRAPQRVTRTDRLYILIALVVAHAALFAAIRAGVVPDASNLPLAGPRAPAVSPLLQHVIVQALYIGAFACGTVVDRRFADAFRRADAVLRAAARSEEELARARAGLDRAVADLGGGLFTGTTVGGFKVGRLIGRGGMGEVYEASRDDFRGRVALKLLRGDRAGDPEAVARFAAEAAVVTRIDSPFVARVLAAGGEDAVPYIAMEHVDGRSLAQLLRLRGRLTAAGVLSLVRHITEGLTHVHGAGVAHLDVKPSNIILTEALDAGSRWRLVDFGVARLVAAKGAAPERAAGTPQYMAPEQALGETVDTRADLYSLTAVVYRALTGRPPFTGDDATSIAQDVRRRGPPDPRFLVAAPADVALALRIGLSPWAEHRFTTATELRVAFERAFDGVLDEPMRARARALVAAAPWTRET